MSVKPSRNRKLYVSTHGCQMNVHDSERMVDVLGQSGFELASNREEADFILINTCHIREKAAEKVYSELGRYKPLKRARPDLLIGVAGCVAQAEGAEIFRRQPLVDIVVGPQSYHRLPGMVEKAINGEKQIDTEFPEEDKFDHLPGVSGRARRTFSSFLTVQEGCDKFCSFCVVPYTRGAESSRPVASVLADARNLADDGVVEITLLGQNVNAYHGIGPDGSEWSLARLIRAMAELDGIERIRFTTSHPKDMSDDLVAAFGDTDKLMPYLHLPVQSGSDRVLRAMNRRHTSAFYRGVIERTRKSRPDIAISGDFIVGFPGETESDFRQTLRLCDEIVYAQAYSFKYSARPGTPAAERDQVDEAEKSDRLARLQEVLSSQQREFQRSQVDRVLPVLLEKRGRLGGQLVGRSPYMNSVHVQAGDILLGQIVPTRILKSEPNSLAGEIVHGLEGFAEGGNLPNAPRLDPGRQERVIGIA